MNFVIEAALRKRLVTTLVEASLRMSTLGMTSDEIISEIRGRSPHLTGEEIRREIQAMSRQGMIEPRTRYSVRSARYTALRRRGKVIWRLVPSPK